VPAPEIGSDTGVFENSAYTRLNYESLVRNDQKLDTTVSLFSQLKRISFQLSNICNYSFVHKKCPLHGQSRQIVLSSAIITNTLDELSKIGYSGIVAFHIYNEPLIDPRLFSLIEETSIRCPNARIYILTNGFYLNQTVIDELTAKGIWLLIVSAYGKSEFDRLSTYDVAMPYKVIHASLDDRQNLYDRPLLDVKAHCYPFTTDLSISCTGEVTLCCLDWDRRFVFGNLNDERLRSVLDKKEVRDTAVRLMHGERTLDICRRCDWVR
jgi:2-deoxy-scyllo-inosamine dehydrogenase (SAM-dependent)